MGNDSINGGAGNDYIDASRGTDTVTQTGSTGGRDIVNGGEGIDTFVLNGVAAAETFRIFTRDAAEAVGITGLHANTEIVVTLNGSTNAQVIAGLDNIEEINVNALNVTSPGGVAPRGSGSNGGDTIFVIGDFNTTSLNYDTITVTGGNGDDIVDISGLTSDHRLVFNAGAGNDQVVGGLRPQDLVDLSNGLGGFTDEALPASPAHFRPWFNRDDLWDDHGRLEIGRIDHDCLAIGSRRCRQAFHHADEDAFVASPLLAIIERLCRAIFPRRIPPPQPIAIDENDTAQNAPVINPLAPMALRKIGPKTRHLLVRQPEQITRHQAPHREPESQPSPQINGSRP